MTVPIDRTEVIRPETTAHVAITGDWPRETIQPGDEPFTQLEMMILAGHVIPYRPDPPPSAPKPK